jgi:hypothetical protein
MYRPALLFLVAAFTLCNACKINFKVKSGTKRPFQAEIMIPSIGKNTERVTIDQINVVKRTMVSVNMVVKVPNLLFLNH